ncbi:MAG: serine hydrolase domain-containing protein [Myxococcaceae bacterium]
MDAVRRLFEHQHARGLFPGGQLVVRRAGEVLLDMALGTARGFRPSEHEPAVAVTPDTRFSVFSASKGVVAVAIAMLEDRGALDVSASVAKYFPEFAANGKGELTVLDVLTHRACVFTPELVASPADWGSLEKVRAALIAATPRFRRGTLAYMPYEYGWILAEVVRGATGRSLDAFIEAELGLRFGAREDELGSLARTYWVGTRPVVVAGRDLKDTFEADNNLPAALMAFVPAAGLITNARTLAQFYDSVLSGRFISPETLRRYAGDAPLSLDRSNRIPMRMARGFMLGNRTPSIYGWWNTHRVFGHAGAFSALGYGDPDRQLAVSIVTNGNRGPYDALFRFAPLGSAIRRALS